MLLPVMIIALFWKIKYYRNIKPLLISIFIVGLAYIIWDVIVTDIGHWAFNDDYLMGIRILGLPLEEILFFIVVPFACIFIYENLYYYLEQKELVYNQMMYIFIAIIFIIIGLVFNDQGYTMLAMFSCAAFFIVAVLYAPEVLRSNLYWYYIVVSFIPFIIFNFLLTSYPIVTYNPAMIWGGDGWWNGRFLTIPLEDFFYNFSMLSFYFLVYIKAKSFLIKD
jgi:lycopene cyclase domain-containing protein